MIGWEKRVLLRHYLAQGLTKAVIAERLGINRRTINRWISKGDLDRDVDATVPRYGPRPAVPTKLDPFKPIIETRLKALPELSAVRLLEEIRAAGYTGGYTQLKEYVRKIRPRETEAVVRFETPPGHQAQVDFADFRLPWGKRYALLVVLGYSRLLWLRFFARKDICPGCSDIVVSPCHYSTYHYTPIYCPLITPLFRNGNPVDRSGGSRRRRRSEPCGRAVC